MPKKVLKIASEPVVIDSYFISSTTSIGILGINENISNVYEAIKKADSAMYKAKKDSKNSIRIYDEELEKEIEERYRIKNDLEIAIKEHQFVLHLQPQYDESENIVAAEALLRWDHPEKGFIYPDKFLDIANEFNLMPKITQEVLILAIDILNRLEKKIKIAVNIAGTDICDAMFYNNLQKVLKDYEDLKEYIEMEITEQILVADINSAIDTMQILKCEKIEFSIDDFGTGCSSLQYLKKLPVNKLKIDMSFVRDMFDDKNDYEIVKTIVNMAKSLNLKTVGEGVETRKHFEELKRMGVDYFQGYYFSKPVSYDEFIKLL